MKEVDYLIVGQGLAGTLLSYHLLKRGSKIKILDAVQLGAAHQQTASYAAAGIFNPVTGRAMVKTWRADELFPYLHACYQELEQLLETQFLYKKNIYRPFSSVREQNEWIPKGDNKEFAPYVEYVSDQPVFEKDAYDEMGGLMLRQSGYVDLPQLVGAYREYLEKQGVFEKHNFSENLLDIHDDHIQYNGCYARKIIFCDGSAGRANPYFGWLPFRLVKGEVLYIKLSVQIPVILNRGVFVLPFYNGLYKVGATYEHKDLSSDITQKAKSYLCEKLEALLKLNYEVVGQDAGVRPATKDRRPMIGLHPEYKPLGVFNGFGSKGVSLAPYFARQFAAFLEGEGTLDKAINIDRFIEDYCSATAQ